MANCTLLEGKITDQILAEEKQNLEANQPVAAGSVLRIPSILASKPPNAKTRSMDSG